MITTTKNYELSQNASSAFTIRPQVYAQTLRRCRLKMDCDGGKQKTNIALNSCVSLPTRKFGELAFLTNWMFYIILGNCVHLQLQTSHNSKTFNSISLKALPHPHTLENDFFVIFEYSISKGCFGLKTYILTRQSRSAFTLS